MTTASTRPTNLAIGVAMIVAAAFLISVQDVIVKNLDNTLPLWQLFALRGLFTAPILAALALSSARSSAAFHGVFAPWALVRGASITIGLFGFYAALPFISLATAGAGIYLAPIFIALMSSRLLGEPVSRFGWIGVALAFVGALVLLQPGSDTFTYWAVLPVFGAVLYAVGHMLTRLKCQAYSSASLAFSYNLCMTTGAFLVSGLLLIWQPAESLQSNYPFVLGSWTDTTAALWLLLAGMGALFAAIAMLLAGAYKSAPPSIIGTLEYSYLIFAILWDILFFATIATPATLIGIGSIIIGGWLVLRPQNNPPES